MVQESHRDLIFRLLFFQTEKGSQEERAVASSHKGQDFQSCNRAIPSDAEWSRELTLLSIQLAEPEPVWCHS